MFQISMVLNTARLFTYNLRFKQQFLDSVKIQLIPLINHLHISDFDHKIMAWVKKYKPICQSGGILNIF
jgi:hypothetical protein